MSYTPTTWATGDTVTATKLNKMEQGIANAGSVAVVCVDFANATNKWEGSVSAEVFYAKWENAINAYSIESIVLNYYTVSPWAGVIYLTVPLTGANDDLKPYVGFSYAQSTFSSYVTSGGVSSSKVQCFNRISQNTWESGGFEAFEISGAGKIIVGYSD